MVQSRIEAPVEVTRPGNPSWPHRRSELIPSAYAEYERAGTVDLPNGEIEAFQPELWHTTGYQVRVHDEQKLCRYID